MKIFITGGSGLLGQYLNRCLSGENEILTQRFANTELFGGNSLNYNNIKLDIRDSRLLEKTIKEFKPEAVVHTACYSRPEICAELDEKEVRRLNVEVTGNIARICFNKGIKLIYTSTDLVYDGNKGIMLNEQAEINPVTLYALTKLEGELAISEETDNYIILRTALMIGFGLLHAKNNFHSMFENFSKGLKSKLFYDQYRTPLGLPAAARIINGLCKMKIKGEVLNFGGSERVSRLQIGEVLCEVAGFDKSLIEKISINDIIGLPQVPDVSMDTTKLRSLGFEQKNVRETIIEILKNRQDL